MSPPNHDPSSTTNDTLQWGTVAPSRDLTGVTLGDFQVERQLGRGGMGEVYLARQVSLNRPVALKVLRPDLLTKPTYISRFEAEATAVAKLNHPNIVHVYTLGSVDGFRFIAMEYVQGANLRDYIKKKGAVDYPLALSIMRQAGVAVGAAGEIGLVHRDIKPENLMLTRKGQVKVADFGLCRDLDAEGVHLTQTGITMGTPLYMSPEQAQGHALDHRSDLYSLGVTFYQMIAGVPPFTADSPIALAFKHVKDKPASLAVHRPDVPPDLDRLVLKLMAKAPRDRYQSAGEMLRDLARVREALQTPTVVQPATDLTGTDLAVLGPAPGGGAVAPARRAGVSVSLRALLGPPASAPRRFGLGPRLAVVALAMALGALAGWLNRPEDLLAAGTAGPKAPPGLWLAPQWREVPQAATAEAQYHDAQLRATGERQEAAWLAVPGYYPKAREWASRSYTQLARLLLTRREADALRVLAGEIDRWDDAHAHERELAQIARAGVHALEGDMAEVVGDFGPKREIDPANLTDPALLELSLEVTEQAEQAAVRDGSAPNQLERQGLRAIANKLLNQLQKAER